ncbi:PDDEXK nuclease domain-containing protein [Streptomyces sp. A3M-1-3]|uniref:PDDEXK nuclease domain-containing protein n=1 Tax=Streptomyces sp. A3M-1-3 TaxID=2962044 RepID=UPI0020B6E7B1|nr:PDDEXK nuclease domain-containing protein [Streptomyces sp. A3M-1-3]MCP3819053.1 PDDEXK nuclease domain-containing protein [Streptomyces sp. A3M-1-3]
MTDAHAAKPALPAPAGELPTGFFELIDDLKAIVSQAHVRAQLKVNTEMICMYWDIGRTLLDRREREGWGAKVIDRVSVELRTAFPNQRGFSRTNLKYMQQMARLWPESIGQQVAGQLPWGHLQLLMDKCKTRFELDFYAQHAVHFGWSRNRLDTEILGRLHLTQGAAANNFDVTLPEQSAAATEVVKDPYHLDFTRLTKDHSERDLEDALVANLVQFLTELGVGFAFVGRQYPIKVGDQEYRIDLLFYHCRLHRYVVIELKTTKAEPEHIGKLGFYVTVVDDLVRDKERDDPTLGILIAKSRHPGMAEYALQSNNAPLAISTYAALPEEMRALLPSAEDLSRVAYGVPVTTEAPVPAGRRGQ